MIMTQLKHDLRQDQAFLALFLTRNPFRAFRFAEFTRGMPAQTNARAGSVILFNRLCPALFYRHDLSDFGQFCQILNTLSGTKPNRAPETYGTWFRL